MRNRFDQELEQLNNELIEMGALIERAIGDASRALLEKDLELAKKAIEHGGLVDDKEKTDRAPLPAAPATAAACCDGSAHGFHGAENDH